MKSGEKIGVGVLVIGGITGLILWATKAKAKPEPELRPPPCGNYGDVDNDGLVTMVDANLVSEYVTGKREPTAEQLIRADVNGDGIVNIKDAMLIGQYARGIIDTFPVCEVE